MATVRAKTAKVFLRWAAGHGVPLGGGYFVYMSARNGEIDFEADPLNANPIDAWPVELAPHKIGDGLGPDGSGPDGFGEGGFPNGEGPDGYGPDGFGTTWFEYTTGVLEDGTYKFAVCPVDRFGNINTADAIETVISPAGTPHPPTDAQPKAYDLPTKQLTVEWQANPKNSHQ